MDNVTPLPRTVETGAYPLAFSGSRRRLNPGLRLTSPTSTSVCLGRGDRGFWLTGIDDADRAYLALLAADAAQVGYTVAGVDLPATHRCLELDALLGPLLVAASDHRLPGILGDVLAADVADWSLAYGVHAGPALERRQNAVVRVTNLGRAGQQVAHLLAAAGVGTLLLEDDGATTAADLAPGYVCVSDLGRPRQAALIRRLDERHRHTRFFSGATPAEADVTVSFPTTRADLELAPTETQLPVRFGDGEATVGPLIIPGVTACLPCALGRRLGGDPSPHPGEVTLASVVSSLAATHTLMVLDRINAPATLGHELTIDLATGSTRLIPATASPTEADGPPCVCAD